MKPSVFLLVIVPRHVFALVNMLVGIQHPCESIVDCFALKDSRTICYQGHCVPCRGTSESCSSSSHCCSGSRCYRHRCTALVKTGQSCRLSRQCLDLNDYCVNQKCTQCKPVGSPCLIDPLATPCCVGQGICREDICQPAHTDAHRCADTFDCANDLVCLAGTCQNPLGPC